MRWVTLPEPIVCAVRAVKLFMKHALNETPASFGSQWRAFRFCLVNVFVDRDLFTADRKPKSCADDRLTFAVFNL
jgi:hypothetical protein